MQHNIDVWNVIKLYEYENRRKVTFFHNRIFEHPDSYLKVPEQQMDFNFWS